MRIGTLISAAMTKKPARMVTIDRKTERLAIGMNDSTPKTWPIEETRHRPVEVTTKKM